MEYFGFQRQKPTAKVRGQVIQTTKYSTAWNELDKDILGNENLVGSMKQRCQAVIDSKGYPTKY